MATKGLTFYFLTYPVLIFCKQTEFFGIVENIRRVGSEAGKSSISTS